MLEVAVPEVAVSELAVSGPTRCNPQSLLLGIRRKCCRLMGMLSHQGNTDSQHTVLNWDKQRHRRLRKMPWAKGLVVVRVLGLGLAAVLAVV